MSAAAGSGGERAERVAGPSLSELAARHMLAVQHMRETSGLNVPAPGAANTLSRGATHVTGSTLVTTTVTSATSSSSADCVKSIPAVSAGASCSAASLPSVSSLLDGLVIADVDEPWCSDDDCSANSNGGVEWRLVAGEDVADESTFSHNAHLTNIDRPVTIADPSPFSHILCCSTCRHAPPPPSLLSGQRRFDAVHAAREYRDHHFLCSCRAPATKASATAASQQHDAYFYDFCDPPPEEVRRRRLQQGPHHMPGPARRVNKEEQYLELRRYIRAEAEKMTSKRERTRIYVSFSGAALGRRRFGFDSRGHWARARGQCSEYFDAEEWDDGPGGGVECGGRPTASATADMMEY